MADIRSAWLAIQYKLWSLRDRAAERRARASLSKVTVTRRGRGTWTLYTAGNSLVDDLRIALYAAALEQEHTHHEY